MMSIEIRDTKYNVLLALHIIDTGANAGIGYGVKFLTQPTEEMQVGVMKHKAGTVIATHRHNKVGRVVHNTSEVLYVNRGALEASIYDQQDNLRIVMNVLAGDMLILFRGGHGFKVIQDAEIYEFKQGPYAGDNDKTQFTSSQETDNVGPTV